MFWLGFALGAFLGVNFGVILIALLKIDKR